jgi:hypothetical protein
MTSESLSSIRVPRALIPYVTTDDLTLPPSADSQRPCRSTPARALTALSAQAADEPAASGSWFGALLNGGSGGDKRTPIGAPMPRHAHSGLHRAALRPVVRCSGTAHCHPARCNGTAQCHPARCSSTCTRVWRVLGSAIAHGVASAHVSATPDWARRGVTPQAWDTPGFHLLLVGCTSSAALAAASRCSWYAAEWHRAERLAARPSAMLHAVAVRPSAMLHAVAARPSAMLHAVAVRPSAMLHAVAARPSAMLHAVQQHGTGPYLVGTQWY